MLLLFTAHSAISQTPPCKPGIDSAAVVRIAKKRGVYWTENWACPPRLTFDSLNCQWKLFTCKTKHTTKGDCKYTNGCTVSTTATLVVHALTGQSQVQKREKLYHNYE